MYQMVVLMIKLMRVEKEIQFLTFLHLTITIICRVYDFHSLIALHWRFHFNIARVKDIFIRYFQVHIMSYKICFPNDVKTKKVTNWIFFAL